MSITQGLETMYKRANVTMKAYAEKSALKLQNYMRNNYKWTPKSNRAHQSLTGTVKEDNDGFTIVLAHGVEYGVFLELAHEKKYAITIPTAKAKGQDVIKEFEGLLNNIRDDMKV